MNEQEEWREVLDGHYAVSNLGRVKRLTVPKKGGRAKEGFIYKAFPGRKGYIFVRIAVGGKYLTRRLHRIVAHAFLGPCPNGKEVNHKDGDKGNNRSSNLEYVTGAENLEHAVRMGLTPKGRECPQAILNSSQALEIVCLARAGISKSEIGRRFGVSRRTVNCLLSGLSWSHVTGIIPKKPATLWQKKMLAQSEAA